jgi:small subunit ribosomal protein S14
MAKKSEIAANERRKKTVARYAVRRAELTEAIGVSRITLRTMAHRGELPGITKSSW